MKVGQRTLPPAFLKPSLISFKQIFTAVLRPPLHFPLDFASDPNIAERFYLVDSVSYLGALHHCGPPQVKGRDTLPYSWTVSYLCLFRNILSTFSSRIYILPVVLSTSLWNIPRFLELETCWENRTELGVSRTLTTVCPTELRLSISYTRSRAPTLHRSYLTTVIRSY